MQKVRFGSCGWLLVIGLLGLLGASGLAGAQGRSPFVLPEPLGAHALWGDGEDRLFAAGDSGVYALRRGQGPTELALPERIYRPELTGAGRGESAVVVVWNRDGQVARIRDQRPVASAKLDAGGCLGVVDAAGTFFCVRSSGAVEVWPADEGAVPQHVPEPATGLTVRGATLGPGGRLLIVPESRADPRTGARVVYLLQDGALVPLLLDEKRALPAAARDAVWRGAYYSPATDTLWIGSRSDRLLAFSLQRGGCREVVLADTADLSSLSGGRAPGGREVLWLKAGARFMVYDGERFYGVGLEPPGRAYDVFPIYFDLSDGTGYLLTGQGTKTRRLDLPLWGRDGSAQQRLKQPTLRWTTLPFLTLGLGPVWRLGDQPVPLPPSLPPADPAAAAAGPGAELALDLRLGLGFGARRRGGSTFQNTFWLLPELGYSYGKTAPAATHLFTAGPGFGYGGKLVLVRYAPHFVVGRALGETALGVRNGLGLALLYGLFGVEVAHQYLHYTGTGAGGAPLGGQHDVRLMFSLNMVPVGIAIGALAFFGRLLR